MRQNILLAGLCVTAVGLSAAIVATRRAHQPTADIPVAESASASTEPAMVKYKAVKNKTTSTPVAVPSFHWTEVESTDYKEYIARLRGVQCPEETIRDIIVADINKLYAPREAALKVPGDEDDSVSDDRVRRWAPFERRKQLREIQKEKNALLKELLGIELPLEPLRARGARSYELFEAAFKSLPAEKRELVREIQETYWQTSDSLKDKHSNRRSPAYLEDYKQANIERRAKLMQVLSPEEMDLYEMRTSNVGQNLQYSLEGFNPSEEEFKTIWRIRKGIEEPYGGLLGPGSSVDAAGNPPLDGRTSQERRADALARVKEALGPERARQYELSQDGTYRTLNLLGQRYGLSSETVMQGYDLQQKYRDEHQQLLNNRSLPDADRSAALSLLWENHQKQFSTTVGERAARAFQGNRGRFYDIYE